MAVHKFNREDLANLMSPNAYRAEIEWKETKRYEKEMAKEVLSSVGGAAKQATTAATRAINRELRDDELGQEIYTMKTGATVASSFVAGVALVVAATAVDAIHNKAMLDAQDKANHDYKEETARRFDENNDRAQQTLSSYQQQVEDANARYSQQQGEYYVEFQNKTAEAQRVMDSAQRTYDAERTALRAEETRSDTAYRDEVRAANDSMRSAENSRDASIQISGRTRDDAIHAAEMRYEADARRIERDFSGAERDRELALATTRRDETVARANTTHESNVQRYSSEYDSAVSSAQQRIDSATQRHESEIRSINDRSVTAQTKYDNTINRQNEVIRTEQIKYDDRVKNAAIPLTNAQERLANYQSNAHDRAQSAVIDMYGGKKDQSILDVGRQYTKSNGTREERDLVDRVIKDIRAEERATSKGESYERKTTDAERQSATQIAQKHTMAVVGLDLAKQYGSKEEQQLMKAVRDDIRAERAAAKNGTEYQPKTTPEQRQMATQITERFAVAAQSAQSGADTYHAHGSSTVLTGGGAQKFVQSVDEKHVKIGRELAMVNGTAAERTLLSRVEADLKAQSEATKAGKPHVAQTSAAERKEAEQIARKYAGDISSESGIKATLSSYKTAMSGLQKDLAIIGNQLSATRADLKTTEDQIKIVGDKLGEIKADQKALRTNRNADGTKLTAEERATIAARLKKSGDGTAERQQLAQLKEKRNGLRTKEGDLASRAGKTENLIKGLSTHSTLLQKNGKAIANVIQAKGKDRTVVDKVLGRAHVSTFERIFDPLGAAKKDKKFREDQKNKGSSKAAKTAQKVGVGLIFNSINRISRELSKTMSKGNVIQTEINKGMMNMNKVGRGYNLALSISQNSIKVIGRVLSVPGKSAIKIIGEHTRLGKMISGFLKTDGAKNVLGKLAIVGRGQKNLAGALLKAPGAILSAPMTIKNLPITLAKKAANGTFRLTRKAVGKVGGATMKVGAKALKGGARIAGKGLKIGFNKAIGQRQWYQRLRGRMNPYAEKIGAAIKRVASVIAKPFAAIGKAFSGVFAFIGSIFSYIIGLITTAITFLLGAASIMLTTLIFIILYLAGITALFNMIMNIIKSWTGSEQSLVCNYPEYIMNQAVEYRNAELEILEMFTKVQKDKDVIEVSKEPIYYSMYKTGLTWEDITGEKFLQSRNDRAVAVFNDLDAKYDFNRYVYSGYNGVPREGEFIFSVNGIPIDEGMQVSLYFGSKQLTSYENVKVSYYEYNNYYSANRKASNYEVSNAKDALALVDTLYTNKPDTMQKLEVLSYLGVGDYQIANKDSEVAAKNLFWLTHKFVYNSGNKDEDVWFHYTNDDGSLDTNRKTIVLPNGTTTSGAASSTNCKPDKITVSYKSEEITYVAPHQTVNDIDINDGANCYDEFDVDAGSAKAWTNISERFYDMSASQYYYYQKTRLTYNNECPTGTEYLVGVGANRRTVYKITTNSSYSNDTKSLHWGEKSGRLNFIKSYGDKYHIIDGYGNYMGCYDLSSYKYVQIKNMVTSVTINGKPYEINKNSFGQIGLTYFYLYWKNGGYHFDVMSSAKIPYGSTENYIKQALNGDVISSSVSIYRPSFNKALVKVSCNCEKIEQKNPTTVYKDIYVCRGHVDLDVAIVVSVIDEKGTFFDQACNVPGVEKDQKVKSFLGMMTWDTQQGIFGLGTITHEAYHPYEDWAKDSDYRKLAEAKAQAEISYVLPNGKSANEKAWWVKHKAFLDTGDPQFWSLRTSPEGDVLYGMMYNNNRIYVASYLSGEQKGLEYYFHVGSGHSSGDYLQKTKHKLDICVSITGKPFIYAYDPVPYGLTNYETN